MRVTKHSYSPLLGPSFLTVNKMASSLHGQTVVLSPFAVLLSIKVLLPKELFRPLDGPGNMSKEFLAFPLLPILRKFVELFRLEVPGCVWLDRVISLRNVVLFVFTAMLLLVSLLPLSQLFKLLFAGAVTVWLLIAFLLLLFTATVWFCSGSTKHIYFSIKAKLEMNSTVYTSVNHITPSLTHAATAHVCVYRACAKAP